MYFKINYGAPSRIRTYAYGLEVRYSIQLSYGSVIINQDSLLTQKAFCSIPLSQYHVVKGAE